MHCQVQISGPKIFMTFSKFNDQYCTFLLYSYLRGRTILLKSDKHLQISNNPFAKNTLPQKRYWILYLACVMLRMYTICPFQKNRHLLHAQLLFMTDFMSFGARIYPVKMAHALPLPTTRPNFMPVAPAAGIFFLAERN